MAKRGRKTRGKAGYMISAVAEMYNIHPQTLRLYEREGLLIPSRSDGNTRLYTQEDLEQLETILNLTRDLGVNLAGIEIIMNMRRRMRHDAGRDAGLRRLRAKGIRGALRERPRRIQNALVRISPLHMVRARK